jgi:hypothetical protein
MLTDYVTELNWIMDAIFLGREWRFDSSSGQLLSAGSVQRRNGGV